MKLQLLCHTSGAAAAANLIACQTSCHLCDTKVLAAFVAENKRATLDSSTYTNGSFEEATFNLSHPNDLVIIICAISFGQLNFCNHFGKSARHSISNIFLLEQGSSVYNCITL